MSILTYLSIANHLILDHLEQIGFNEVMMKLSGSISHDSGKIKRNILHSRPINLQI